MPVSLIFENLEDGMTIDEILEQYAVTREEITAALTFAARSAAPPSPEENPRSGSTARPRAHSL